MFFKKIHFKDIDLKLVLNVSEKNFFIPAKGKEII